MLWQLCLQRCWVVSKSSLVHNNRIDERGFGANARARRSDAFFQLLTTNYAFRTLQSAISAVATRVVTRPMRCRVLMGSRLTKNASSTVTAG